MIAAIGDAITSVIGWIGEVVTAVVGEAGALAALLPVLAIGIAISLLFVGVKAIKSFAWGT